ncbi:hypothetical protein [Lacrimispora defluvii]|uniref:Uncharacterized protein n=1 Tax=Lacrimispora defluvii TaxID=2719233 RepID=A0ABX1VKU7_9FIRM|nr:hypothetical protein [Lacrimispora defluvii]NNJ28324.1 hypothetical protein [Lacrimispora defluvii]
MTKQEQTSTEQLTAVTTTEALTTEKESYTETTMEELIRNDTHNIFKGTIGESEVQMNIRREGNTLTASYITRTDDEKTLRGEMKGPTEFQLNDKEGGYLKGTVYDGNLKGTGNISGKDVTIRMYLSTFMPIGYDHDDYYSGDRIMSGQMTSTEVENFAKQIKESITDKEKFIKLFRYPLDIRVNKKVIPVQNEDEMSDQIDTLLAETDFREQIETMYTKYLFTNYQGVCVENGILWFDKDDNGDFKIWSLNYRDSSHLN